MSKKKMYDNIPTTSVREDVIDLEHNIEEYIHSIWADDRVVEYYKKILLLELSDRRLWLTYTTLDYSIIKVARLFSCDRKTVSNAINNIKTQLGI